MFRFVATLCSLWLALGAIPTGPALAEGPPPANLQVGVEVAKLLGELDSDEFDVRTRAAERLEQLVARPELGPSLAAEFQRLLLREGVSFEVRWHVKRWAARLPEAPLKAPEVVTPDELRRLLGELENNSYAVRDGAAQRLEWLASQDAHLPAVTAAIRARLAEPLDTELGGRLRQLLELTRPAMVAEYWQGRRNYGQQHLLVGVPSLGPGAKRPSHFDRIDDRTAHCVSGNTLSPGDYPVGVAFPHPSTETAFFHLVNLPTPRRRLAYEQYVKRDESERLSDISRRTLDRFRQEKRPLTEPELLMLTQLDRKEASRFAGDFFLAVEDEPLPPGEQARFGGRPSRHGMLCGWLAVEGTKEAVPGLLKAIDQQRFLPPTSDSQYRLHLIAALAIAARDPWPDADRWLAGQVPRTDPLIEPKPDGPELGATAAAILLNRRGRQPSEFGVQWNPETPLQPPCINGCRFTSEEARQKVRRWWETEGAK
jgi:hypothetical protein